MTRQEPWLLKIVASQNKAQKYDLSVLQHASCPGYSNGDGMYCKSCVDVFLGKIPIRTTSVQVIFRSDGSVFSTSLGKLQDILFTDSQSIA